MVNNPPLLKEKDKKVKTLSLTQWRKKCDAEMQKLGQMIYPKSLLSGQQTQVMHHFFPKSVSARLRYEWSNLIPLTNGEHMRLHQSGDPTYEQRIIQIKGQDWFDRLQKMRQEGVKVNVSYYQNVFEILQNKKERLT